MAGTPPPAGLLDRAGHVFSLAGQLARAFTDEYERQGTGFRTVDPTAWRRHKPAFEEFCAAVLALRDEMLHPPDGFEPVTAGLLKAAETAKQIRDAMQTAEGQTWQSFIEFRFHLNSVVAIGNEGIGRIRKALRETDPFAFLNQPAEQPGGIDTTPALPRPPHERIAGAARCIPEVLADVEPHPGKAAELVAAVLAKRVQDKGHVLAAAHWAIHESVRAGRLTTGRVESTLPNVGIPNGDGSGSAHQWHGGGRGTKPIPKGKPAPFDRFKVVATPALWEWWTGQSTTALEQVQPGVKGPDGTINGSRTSVAFGGTGGLPTAKITGVVSLNVLRAHLEMVGFPDWRQRLESWSEVPYLRLHCARLFIGQPFSSETIKLLIAWFQTRGLAPEQACHLPLADAVRLLDSAQPHASAPPAKAAVAEVQPLPQAVSLLKPQVASKASTRKGEGRIKLISALTKHHRYAEDGCLNFDPINNNELARQAEVSNSTASDFFRDEFKGYRAYRTLCQRSGELVAALKLLNNEFAPYNLYGGLPDGGDRNDPEE